MDDRLVALMGGGPSPTSSRALSPELTAGADPPATHYDRLGQEVLCYHTGGLVAADWSCILHMLTVQSICFGVLTSPF